MGEALAPYQRFLHTWLPRFMVGVVLAAFAVVAVLLIVSSYVGSRRVAERGRLVGIWGFQGAGKSGMATRLCRKFASEGHGRLILANTTMLEGSIVVSSWRELVAIVLWQENDTDLEKLGVGLSSAECLEIVQGKADEAGVGLDKFRDGFVILLDEGHLWLPSSGTLAYPIIVFLSQLRKAGCDLVVTAQQDTRVSKVARAQFVQSLVCRYLIPGLVHSVTWQDDKGQQISRSFWSPRWSPHWNTKARVWPPIDPAFGKAVKPAASSASAPGAVRRLKVVDPYGW